MTTSMVTTMKFAWWFSFILFAFAVQEEPYQHEEVPAAAQGETKQLGAFPVETRIFNAFPNINASAFLVFEEERISRLTYGHFVVARPILESHADFVIQFKKIPKEEVIRDFTDFGFAQRELSEGAELLIVIGRGKKNPEKPKHDLVIFSPSDTVEPGSSKLYIYNAVWNKESPEKGLNFYGLYLRRNFDGSESESITQLVANVPPGEGREISLEPNTNMQIKAFYHTVKSVHNFKLEESVVSFDGFSAPPDRRSYLVAYGNYHSPDSPPGMQLLRETQTNSASNLHDVLLPLLAVGIASFISL